MAGSESPLSDALVLEEALRRRLAADLHDDPLQALAAVAMGLELARMQRPEESAQLREIEDAAREATRRLRRMLAEITGPERSEPLAEALEAHCGALGERCSIEVDGEPPEPQRRLVALIAAEAAATGAATVRIRHSPEGTEVAVRGASPLDAELATARARLAGGECVPAEGGGFVVRLPAA